MAYIVTILLLSGAIFMTQIKNSFAENEKIPKQIEQALLKLFNITERPKPIPATSSNTNMIPEILKEMYHQQRAPKSAKKPFKNANMDVSGANTVRSFVHTETEIDKNFKSHHKFRLFFNISSSVPKSETLKAAKLILNSAIEPESLSDQYVHKHIFIYDILRPGDKERHEELIKVLIDTKKVNLAELKKFTFNVQSAVVRWLQHPQLNHGLLVNVIDYHNNSLDKHKPHIRLKRSLDENDNKQPVLFTYTDDGKSKPEPVTTTTTTTTTTTAPRRSHYIRNSYRNRSSLRRSQRKKMHRGVCKRHSLYVDFADVGWNDWIVAPAGVEIYYCHGTCNYPLTEHMNTTNHAIVQTIMNSINPSLVPKSCCVPTSLSTLSLLYVEAENKVVLKNYQDMRVLGCGCL